MAIRTTSTAVQAILKWDYDRKTDLTPFIESASALIDDVATCAIAKGQTINAIRLELLERWTAAHVYMEMKRQFAARSVQGAVTGGSFTGQFQMYFEKTTYGQMAMVLDTTGCLKSLAQGQRASMDWLGKAVAEQIPYCHRMA